MRMLEIIIVNKLLLNTTLYNIPDIKLLFSYSIWLFYVLMLFFRCFDVWIIHASIGKLLLILKLIFHGFFMQLINKKYKTAILLLLMSDKRKCILQHEKCVFNNLICIPLV